MENKTRKGGAAPNKQGVTPYKQGAVLSYATLGVNCLVSIFFTPFMIRCMGEGEYGLYQLIGAFAGYLSILDMGMSSAVTKYVAKFLHQGERREQENFLALMLAYYSLISVVAVLAGSIMYRQLGPLFAGSLSSGELQKAQRMFVLLLFNLIVTLFGGIFRGVMDACERFFQTKGAELLRVSLRIVMIYAILTSGGGSVGLVMTDTMLNILFGAYRMLYCLFRLGIRFRFGRTEPARVKEIFFYSFFVFLNLVFDQLNWKIDHTILGVKVSTAAVTSYSIGMNFSNYFMNFSIAVKSLFLPKVMHMEVEGADGGRFTQFLARTGRLQGYVLFYLYLAFLFLGRQFISLIMGKDYYEAWLSAVFVMTGLLVPLLQNAGHPILQAKNKHHVYVLVCLCISVVNAVSTWYIVDSRGIAGAAFMTMLSFVAGQAVFLSWYYHKKLGIKMGVFYRAIWKGNMQPLAGVILVEICLAAVWQTDTWVEFLLHGLLYSGLYFASIYRFGMNEWEKQFLFGFVKPLLRRDKKGRA